MSDEDVAAALDAFRAGDRPDDVVIYLADDAVDDPDALAGRSTRVGDGIALVLPGETGRRAFAAGTGADAMAFAREASGTEGHVARSLHEGRCPAADGGDGHAIRHLLAFAEAANEAAGGRYADGDVVHAYVQCECGERYSDRWVAADRPDEGG